MHITGNDNVIGYNMIETPSSTSTSEDEVAIRFLYQQLMDDWNEGTGKFLEYVGRYCDTGRVLRYSGLNAGIVTSIFKMGCRFPNRIVNEYTTSCYTSVQLSRDKSWLFFKQHIDRRDLI